MRFESSHFLSLLIFFFCKRYVLAIRCYVCRSDEDKNCAKGAKFLGEYVKTCNEEGSGAFCRTINQQVFFMEDPHRVVIRECAYKHDNETCYKSSWPDVQVKTCDCGRDLCNSGTGFFWKNVKFLLITVAWAAITVPKIIRFW